MHEIDGKRYGAFVCCGTIKGQNLRHLLRSDNGKDKPQRTSIWYIAKLLSHLLFAVHSEVATSKKFRQHHHPCLSRMPCRIALRVPQPLLGRNKRRKRKTPDRIQTGIARTELQILQSGMCFEQFNFGIICFELSLTNYQQLNHQNWHLNLYSVGKKVNIKIKTVFIF